MDYRDNMKVIAIANVGLKVEQSDKEPGHNTFGISEIEEIILIFGPI